MIKFKLKNEQGYKPPKTWEEVSDLERPLRIRAARYFLRQAAIRLNQDADLHSDDIVMLFNAIPEWISTQRHAHKREVAELRKTWICLKCNHRAPKADFFKNHSQLTILAEEQLACCPSCGRTDAEEYVPPAEAVPQMEGVTPAPLGKVCQEEPGDGKASFCACDGQPCPVCEAQGRKGITIEHHSCIVCETLYCPVCHGIVTAGSSRAFDNCARCKC